MKRLLCRLFIATSLVCLLSCGDDDTTLKPREEFVEEMTTANVSNRNNVFKLSVNADENGIYTYQATSKSTGQEYKWIDKDRKTATSIHIKCNDTDVTLTPVNQDIAGIYETDESLIIVVRFDYTPTPYVSSLLIYEATGITEAGITYFVILAKGEAKVIESAHLTENNSLLYFERVVTDLKGNVKYVGDFRSVYNTSIFLTDTIIFQDANPSIVAVDILSVREVAGNRPRYEELWRTDLSELIPSLPDDSFHYEVIERTSTLCKLKITIKDKLNNTKSTYTAFINPTTGELTDLTRL